MSTGRQLTITLPEELAARVHAQVASGQFPSESDVIQSALLQVAQPLEGDDPELEHWLRTVGVERYDAYDRNPEDVYTSEQVLKSVAEHLATLPDTK
jgi:antitoxin ParD1/3/4